MVFLLLVLVGRIHEVIPGLSSLPLATGAVALAALALALGGYLKRLPVVFRAPQTRYAFLLLGLGALSVPFALWPGGALSSLIVAAKLWVLCVIVPVAVATSRQLNSVTRTFAVAAALLLAGHVVEAVLGLQGFTDRQALGFDRNDVALFGAMGIPYALAWSGPGKRVGLFGIALTGFLVAGIIATGSRGGFLAMVAVGVIFLLRSRLLSKAKKVGIVVAALAMASVVGTGEYWERVTGIFSNPTEDYNFQAREGRIEIWKRGLGYAASHPVTGVGIGNFPTAEGQALEDLGYGVKWSTAHSAYVLVLAELGVPGILVFCLLLVSIVRETGRSARLRPRGRGPPALMHSDAETAHLAEATRLAFVGYVVAAAFLSAAYSVALLYLVSVATVLYILRVRSRRAWAMFRGRHASSHQGVRAAG